MLLRQVMFLESILDWNALIESCLRISTFHRQGHCICLLSIARNCNIVLCQHTQISTELSWSSIEPSTQTSMLVYKLSICFYLVASFDAFLHIWINIRCFKFLSGYRSCIPTVLVGSIAFNWFSYHFNSIIICLLFLIQLNLLPFYNCPWRHLPLILINQITWRILLNLYSVFLQVNFPMMPLSLRTINLTIRTLGHQTEIILQVIAS